MAKQKIKPKTGVKSLKLPTVLAYLLAGCGVIVIAVFLGYIMVKSFEGGTKSDPAKLAENAVWKKSVGEWKTTGTLQGVSKDANGDGVAVVNKALWEKLPFDSKESLAVAVARAEDIQTLQITDETGASLGICRYGMRLRENK